MVKGGNHLEGNVVISGAKNSTLKLMAASILTDQKCLIGNVPRIRDVYVMGDVLKRLGAELDIDENNEISIKCNSNMGCEAPYELVNKMRASIIVLGPLLARLGKAKVAMPGGCNIGTRKIDIHLKGLAALGADIEVSQGFIDAKAKALRGTSINLDFPSMGATENILMAAVLANGNTIIENAAREPEIVDLAEFLNQMGAKISGAGSNTIEIQGVSELSGAEHSVIPDRVEAGTFIAAVMAAGGSIVLERAQPDHLKIVIEKLAEVGVDIDLAPEGLSVTAEGRPKAANIATLPYPGVPTDIQPQMMVLLSLANGTSVITENVFESRFMFAKELSRMGSDISIQNHCAVVRGVSKLRGTSVRATDLRGGAALVLAGLIAKGTTEVNHIYHIDRGYEYFEQKLAALGADISRVSSRETKTATGFIKESKPYDTKPPISG